MTSGVRSFACSGETLCPHFVQSFCVTFSFMFHELQCSSLWSGFSSSCPPPPPFFVVIFLSHLHCLFSVMGAWKTCMGAHGWVAGIASYGSGTLSGGWLVEFPVEAPGIIQAPNCHVAMQLLIRVHHCYGHCILAQTKAYAVIYLY